MNEKERNEEKMPNYEGKKHPKDARKDIGDADTNVDNVNRRAANSDIDNVSSTDDVVTRDGDIDDVSFF